MSFQLCKHLGAKKVRGKIVPVPCKNISWKDGYCKIHHPDECARRENERQDRIKIAQAERMVKLQPSGAVDSIDQAIALLTKNGYLVFQSKDIQKLSIETGR